LPALTIKAELCQEELQLPILPLPLLSLARILRHSLSKLGPLSITLPLLVTQPQAVPMTLESALSPRSNSVLGSMAGEKPASSLLTKVCDKTYSVVTRLTFPKASFNHGSAQNIDIITRMLDLFFPLFPR